jgi:hypothetical protein
MSSLLRSGHSLLAVLKGLVWVTQNPQRQGQPGETKDPRFKAEEESKGAVLLGVVEGEALLQVLSGEGKFA